jgi:hypothetical protein
MLNLRPEGEESKVRFAKCLTKLINYQSSRFKVESVEFKRDILARVTGAKAKNTAKPMSSEKNKVAVSPVVIGAPLPKKKKKAEFTFALAGKTVPVILGGRDGAVGATKTNTQIASAAVGATIVPITGQSPRAGPLQLTFKGAPVANLVTLPVNLPPVGKLAGGNEPKVPAHDGQGQPKPHVPKNQKEQTGFDSQSFNSDRKRKSTSYERGRSSNLPRGGGQRR